MDQSQCPACSAIVEMVRDTSRDINNVTCPSCGPYAIEGPFHLRIMKGQLAGREKEFVLNFLSAYIREEKPEIVSSTETDPNAYKYYSRRKKQT